jgi:ArsR family transcriptional regulator
MWQRDGVDVVEVAKALASPTRVRILAWLKDPAGNFASRREGDLAPAGVCASLIAEKVGASQPTISRHLEVLRRAGLIETERIAGWSYHRRDETGLARAIHLLTEV